jgi:protein-tyrosine-phosphatase
MSPPTPQRRVLFVCTHNAGRSIVAAALLNAHQPPGVRADSAGTDPSDALNPRWSPPWLSCVRVL